MVSLWYRAPEICLGDVCFSCPVDIWALGCVFAEVLVAAPVYEAHSVVSLLVKVFSALGAPEPGGYLTELPRLQQEISAQVPGAVRWVALQRCPGGVPQSWRA